MCVWTLLSELCGKLQLTHEDPGPRCSYLRKLPSSGSHRAEIGDRAEPPPSETSKKENDGMKVR